MHIEELSNNDFFETKNQVTGSHDQEDGKYLIYPFDHYEIKVKLSYDGKFLGVSEVKINKDFLSHKIKSTPKGYHDVDEFYAE